MAQLAKAGLMTLQTIIECLKQVTTGELPPNTRSGQSFIHDPKVSFDDVTSVTSAHFSSDHTTAGWRCLHADIHMPEFRAGMTVELRD